MVKNDFEVFSRLMVGLADNFGQSLSDAGIALRFKALAGFNITQIEQATMSLLKTRKYTTMPTIADFLEHLSGGSAEDFAAVEVGKVLQAIRKHGSYNSVCFDNATTQAVIMQVCGGWIKLCEDCGAEEPEKWWRKDFVQTWAAYHRQNIKHFGHLVGRNELANSSSDFLSFITPPALVGNVEKAKQVLAAGKTDQASVSDFLFTDNLKTAGLTSISVFMGSNSSQ